MLKAQYFHYDIVETYSLSKIEELKEHRRLRVFHQKGVICSNPKCDNHEGNHAIGKILALGIDNGGNKHWDIYTEDYYPLTVDHIIPKSFFRGYLYESRLEGGSDHIDNLQPMCYLCNCKKGNGLFPAIPRRKYSVREINTDEIYQRVSLDTPIGTEIYKSNGKNKYKPLGTLKQIAPNPYFNDTLSVQVYERDVKSYYLIGSCYVKL